jgi:signal transduction histidine kinase
MAKTMRWLSSRDLALDVGAQASIDELALPQSRLASKRAFPWPMLVVCLVIMLTIFVADALFPTDIIFSLIYAVPLFLCAWTRDSRLLWSVALLAMFFNWAAYVWGVPPALTISNVTLNRALSLGQLLVIAGLLHAVGQQGIRLDRVNRIATVVLEQMPAGVVISAAPSGTIRFANEQAALLWRDFKQPQRPVFEADLAVNERACADSTADLPLMRSIRSGEIVRGQEIAVLRADGRAGVVRAFSNPIRDGEGSIMGAVMSFNDITDLKQAEKERQHLLVRERAARSEAEAANRAKDDFFVNLSHELRSPLSVMSMWLGLLRTGKLEGEKMARAFELIESNAQLQARLINDLLDVSRIILGKLTLEVSTVDLPALVGTAVDAVRPDAEVKGVHLEVISDAPGAATRADAARLQQVLRNLLSNAVKFTPAGGRITVHLRRDQSHAEIVVADTGEGIPPEFLPHVFEGFRQAESDHTRRHAGLGLGLKIVHRLVELHGGTITAESPGVGQGATFSVKLALAAAESSKDDAAAALPATRDATSTGGATLRGVRALIVDDNAGIGEGIAALLELSGARASTVRSCSEAMAVLDREPVDVVLTDIAMPAVGGYALLRELRARTREGGGVIPAVAITACSEVEDQRQARAAGFAAHLTKPVDPAELVAVVADLAAQNVAC